VVCGVEGVVCGVWRLPAPQRSTRRTRERPRPAKGSLGGANTVQPCGCQSWFDQFASSSGYALGRATVLDHGSRVAHRPSLITDY